jgi:hypothetical protein
MTLKVFFHMRVFQARGPLNIKLHKNIGAYIVLVAKSMQVGRCQRVPRLFVCQFGFGPPPTPEEAKRIQEARRKKFYLYGGIFIAAVAILRIVPFVMPASQKKA